MEKKNKKICMFVLNPCTNDTRVLKEADTLGKAGYDVKIIAIVSADASDFIEEKDNVTIYRIQPRAALFYLKKLKQGIRRRFKQVFNGIRLAVHFLFKPRAALFYLKKLKQGIRRRFKQAFNGIRLAVHFLFKRNPGEGGIHLRESSQFIFIKKASHIFIDRILFVSYIILYLFKFLMYPFSCLWKFTKKQIKHILWKYHRLNSYMSYWFKAKKLAESFEADVYHAHDLNTLLPAYLAAKKTGAKVVYDSHELYTERNLLIKETAFNKWTTKKCEAFLIRRANAVIAVNSSIAIELSNMYNIPIPFVIMNCPNYRLGHRNNLLREKLGLNGSQQIILYLGAITFNRGLEESITAIKKVRNGVLAFMGYGTSEYISGLKERISRSGVEEKVYFVPPVKPHEVVKFAASADIGIAPIQNACKSYYYCSPNKLFESMMAGLPVAASNFPEMRRVIEETNCGYLFDSSDPEDIAKVLNNMINNTKEIEQMRKNALQHAHKYSWEEESEKFLAAYEGLFTE